jgi:hypothetical protein
MPEQRIKSRQYSVVVKAHIRERKLRSWKIRDVPELGRGEGFPRRVNGRFLGDGLQHAATAPLPAALVECGRSSSPTPTGKRSRTSISRTSSAGPGLWTVTSSVPSMG